MLFVCLAAPWKNPTPPFIHQLGNKMHKILFHILILTFFRKVQIHLNVCHTEAVQKLFDQRKVSELFYIPEHMPTTGFCLSGSFLCDTQCCPENKLNIIRSDIIKENNFFLLFCLHRHRRLYYLNRELCLWCVYDNIHKA